jgi:endonuclease YncB( thermonuclease family)
MRSHTTALLLALLSLAASAGATEVVPFIENDYARALQQARKAKLPIFVDAWAPW